MTVAQSAKESHVITQVSAKASRPARTGLLMGACVLGFALALTGCGGSDDDSAGGDNSSQTGSTATRESSSAPAATADTAGGATTSSDRLPDLDSYRYAFKLEGTAGLIAEISGSSIPDGVDPETGTLAFVVEGSYVNPDRGEATISLGDTTLIQVVIGSDVWINLGDGFDGPSQLSSSGDSDYSFVANFWDTSATESLKDFKCSSDHENVNGVSTRKCTADRATVERLNQEGKLFTTGVLDLQEFTSASAEIWVTDEDKVIRFQASLAGTDSSDRKVVFKMEVDISDINASFTIDPPL